MNYLIFSQTNGGVTADDGTAIATGWSGHGEGKNNPAMQFVRCVGPLPQGWYTIDPWEMSHPVLGPMVAHLTPDPDNDMQGRNAFYFHGPSSDPSKYGQESEGCIVVPHFPRQAIKDTGMTRLQVVA